MGIPASLAKQIAEAKTSGGGTPIKDGEYVLVVKQILCEKMFTGLYVIPEFDVVACEKTRENIEPNKVGSDCSCTWSLDKGGKAGEAAKGNIKNFFCGLLGLDEGAADLAEMLSCYAGGKNDPDRLKARGMLICAKTYRKTTQSGPNVGKEGCYVRFSPVAASEGNSTEEIAKRRAELDTK
jgi:hypothetical protein